MVSEDRVAEAVDPRVARSRRAILDAASALLLDGGTSSVTIEAVVERSGVARTTIYRHWPTRDDLLAATFEDLLPDLPQPPDDLPFPDAVRFLARAMLAMGTDEHWLRLLPSLIESARLDRQLEVLKDERYGRQLTTITDLLQRGIDEGDLRPDLDVTIASLSFFGPMVAAVMLGDVTLDEGLADTLVDRFLDGHRRR